MRTHHHIFSTTTVRPVLFPSVFSAVQTTLGGEVPSGLEYLTMQLGTTQIRKGIRVVGTTSYFVTDKTITPTGFAGVENTDWENIQIITLFYFDQLAPSGLTLTVLSDTSIKLDWTNNSVDAEGVSIERSTNGVTYTEINTVLSSVATYTDTTGADGTRYYYRLKSYKGTIYSAASTAANDWTAIKMVLTSTGTGTGVSTFRVWFGTTDVVVTLDGNGKWYSDSGGTANESTSYTFPNGSLQTRYLKVTSGVSNMLIFAKGNWIGWGSEASTGWTTPTNGATIAKNVSNLTTLTVLVVTSANTISGTISELVNLVKIWVLGSNTLTGSITGLINLIYLAVVGNNTLSGDIGGIGTAAMINGITYFDLAGSNRMVDYTAGATWSLNDTSRINPAAGYGYSATEIDNILIDMAASLGTVTAKTITLQGSSAARTAASNAAVATLNGKGWTIITN